MLKQNLAVNASWWQKGIIYQIYPRSFMDSDGDGIGDLTGIVKNLDYLQWLGVDAIWISPIYPSPMADFGYDISDHTAIHPIFGTLADFDQLLSQAHACNIKVILDFVPNHTSEQHPWFLESRSSRDNPKRSWYIWADPAADGGPPNNWVSNFGGPAWTLDEKTGQYYYHAYLPQQPDVNWRNPEVEAAMLGVMRFWLERGVDGFRVDALRQIFKDDQLRDNPINPDYELEQGPYKALLPLHTTDLPETLAAVERMRQTLDVYSERVLIGELYLPIERLVAYYGVNGGGCHLPFNFHLIFTAWDAVAIATLIQRYEAALPPSGWPNWVLGNHDKARIASRIGKEQARIAAMLLLTLRGTPTLYYGDEIGLHDVPIPPDQVQDPFERNVPGLGLGRDPERTPMQWNAEHNAGFTAGAPWLPLADDYAVQNVAAQQQDPNSILALYRRLIALRQQAPALQLGAYRWVQSQGTLLAYVRHAADQQFLIILNLGSEPAEFSHPDLDLQGQVIVSSNLAHEGQVLSGTVTVSGDEGLLIRLTAEGN
ncbi:alpha-amylase family glycosyl hydrolase [Pseudanabaena sp. FACHB-2040]|uniref:alpha-amylase family glycosyl hydrolase n=1 Tax=Pseudanabaena sp. FACHB-2040 TaxID=2692859 RepID=UPI00168828C1|nr:alpha-amylase family glycosyl hydrolase [Pseudanabaena sp. FACHB-2040]MBD2259418.1 DUF3459 domain-containing protein [Pseudanabaena sp. FACHB-2040]